MTIADVVNEMNLWQFGDYTDWENHASGANSITLIGLWVIPIKT